MRKENKQTHLAIKPTTKIRIRLKYWFDYLLGIKSPSREFAKELEGNSFSEKEFTRLETKKYDDFYFEAINPEIGG